jgi:hypothetical protein
MNEELQSTNEELLVEVDAVNRRGSPIRCAVNCTPLRQEGEIRGVILLMRRGDPPELPLGGPAPAPPPPRRARRRLR